MRALVVEDELTTRGLIEDILALSGYEVVAVGDAEAALAAFLQSPFTIVLIDWGLPGADGVTLCQQIRAIPASPPPYILFLTGRNRQEDLQAILSAGADDYLAKPFGVDALETRLAIAQQRIAGRARRQQAEHDAHTSASHLAALLETVPVPVWIAHDPDCARISSNPAADALLRRSGSDKSSRLHFSTGAERVLVYQHGALLSVNDLPLQRAVLSREPVQGIDLTLVFPDGETRYIYGYASSITDSAGRIQGGVAVFMDITDRRRAGEQLRRNEAQLREAEQIARLGHWAWDHRSDAVTWSEGLYRLFGQDPSTFAPTFDWFVNNVHPDDRPLYWDALDKAMQDLVPLAVECRMLHADGAYRVFDIQAKLLLDSEGRLASMLGTVQNITQRKRGEAQLAARLRQQAVVADLGRRAISEPIDRFLPTLVEEVARTVDVELVEVLELVPQESALYLRAGIGWQEGLIGTATVTLGDRSQAGYMLSATEPVIVEDLQTEDRFVSSELLQSHGAVSGMSVVIPMQPDPYGVLGVHTQTRRTFNTDDSNFIQAVGSIVAAAIERDRAERAIRERDERLDQAQKMEGLGRLAGGIAHDFNNVLTVIMGFAEFLEAASVPEQRRLFAHEIVKAAERAAALTSQLLAFSRQQVLDPSEVDLNSVVTDMEELLRRLIGEDIELTLMLDPALGHVHADPGQLGQVILNLGANARDAMPHGGRLTIETGNLELDAPHLGAHEIRDHGIRTPGPYVYLAVSDTGIGMDQETQAKIFEPFFTTKEQGKGTGLGLATVYGIVKQSGGDIWVDSEPGRGTSFTIYLPLHESPAEAAAIQKPTARMEHGAEYVLLVEDEPAVRAFAQATLESFGYTVFTASEGAEALVIARSHPEIQLLLTDLVMPGMDGRELANHVRALNSRVRVLYMSGYAGHSAVHRGVLEAGDAFLAKPFTALDLSMKIRQVLDVGDSPRHPSSPTTGPQENVPSAAEIFSLLWVGLEDVVGTASTAALIRRAVLRSAAQYPELMEVVIDTQGLETRLPPAWRDPLDQHTRNILQAVFRELTMLLGDQVGTVVIRMLERPSSQNSSLLQILK